MKSISFSAPMMRKLLEGRKTQTRRIHANGKAKFEVGDLVWVKEGLVADYCLPSAIFVAYESQNIKGYANNAISEAGATFRWPWKRDKLPAMYCPKWASRITIKITRVREVYLGDITKQDAISEGFEDEFAFEDYWVKLNKFWSPYEVVFAYDFEVVKLYKFWSPYEEVFAYDFEVVKNDPR